MTEAPPAVPPSPPPAMTHQPCPVPYWAQPPRKSAVWKVFKVLFVLLFIGSAVLNACLLMLVGALFLQTSGASMAKNVISEGAADQVVAVYAVNGVIGDRAAEGVRRFHDAVRDDKNIKAVVLRVESPGGGVSASDEIHSMVQSIRAELGRPVVVSMGGVAASGGYYISAPADEIYAEPTTVTGSIGVLAMWPVLKGLMDKCGIEPVLIRSSHAEEWKAKENFIESPTPAVRRDVQEMLDAMQDRFEQVVREGRGERLKMAATSVPAGRGGPEAATRPASPAPFNGKTYLTKDAIALGLVDREGYLHDAARAAADRANLKSPRVVQYSVRVSPFQSLMGGADGEDRAGFRLDVESVERLTAPRMLMLWKPE
jgi:protease IV